MTPLTAEQALGELRKFAGIQFDPVVVDAFVRTAGSTAWPIPGRREEPAPDPAIAQAASRMTQATATGAARPIGPSTAPATATRDQA